MENPLVAAVREDAIVRPSDVDLVAGWALGRIDQRFGPSDNQFSYSLTGQSQVNIYIIDSGVDRNHPDFAGRLFRGSRLTMRTRRTSTAWDTGLLWRASQPARSMA